MSTTEITESGDASLLKLWEKEMVSRLSEVAIKAIRPAVEEEAIKVVRELAPILTRHYDVKLDQLLIEIKMTKPKEVHGYKA